MFFLFDCLFFVFLNSRAPNEHALGFSTGRSSRHSPFFHFRTSAYSSSPVPIHVSLLRHSSQLPSTFDTGRTLSFDFVVLFLLLLLLLLLSPFPVFRT